jgi:mRNA-degrading endonuclease RelE of RelBE toxin-antitoxin system
MDKIEKFLRKLNAKELDLVTKALSDITQNKETKGDIKKLKGYEHVFRIRIHDIWIIFTRVHGVIKVLEISRRSEKTYKNF